MHNRRRLIATSLSLAVAAAALAGCGSDSGGGGGSGSQLDGVSLTVGSKDFTENILVGEMFVQALENEGATVKSQTNLGGTSVARDALLSDEIDVYPEYTGTGWTVHLKNDTAESSPEARIGPRRGGREALQGDLRRGPAEEQDRVGRPLAVQQHLRLRGQR